MGDLGEISLLDSEVRSQRLDVAHQRRRVVLHQRALEAEQAKGV